MTVVPRPVAGQATSGDPVGQSGDRSLADELAAIAERYQISLIYHPALLAGRRAPAVPPQENAEVHLRSLLRESGLICVRLASGTFAVLRGNATERRARRGTIAGRLVDAESGAPIADAHVALLGVHRLAAASGTDGRFQFDDLPAGRHVLRATHVAYDPVQDTLLLGLGELARLEIRLQHASLTLAPVQVEDRRSNARPVVRPEVERLLALSGGTADVVRSLEVLPGVRVDRAMSNLHIQGGDVGEHQVVLDGAPVFEPVHLRGVVGAFSPYALRAVAVHGAGFGAALGSHLAGVITAEHALGSAAGHRLEVRADPLSVDARASFQASLSPGTRLQAMGALRTEHGVAGAYTTRYLRDWNQQDPFLQYASLVSLIEEDPASGGTYARLLRPSADSALTPPAIDFTDVHGAARLQFANGTYIFASAYRSGNELLGGRRSSIADTTAHPGDAYDWQNLSAQATYAVPIGNRTVVKSQVRHSRYALAHRYVAPDNRRSFWLLTPDLELREIRLETRPADDGNSVSEHGASVSIYRSLGRQGTIQSGFETVWTRHRFEIDDLFLHPIRSEGLSRRLAAYAEHEFRRGALTLRNGLRLTKAPGHRALYAEPRVAIDIEPAEAWGTPFSIGLAGGIYRQFLNQYELSSVSPSALMPSIRFWVPTDSSIAPPKAYHASARMDVRPFARWSAGVDLYYRHQPHVLNVDYASLWRRLRDERPPATEQDDFLEGARGVAYGGAASVAYDGERIDAWIRGEAGRSRRTFAFLGDDLQSVPWDEPYSFLASVAWDVQPRLRMAAAWKSTWGRAWAFRRAYYDYLGADALLGTRFAGYDLRRPSEHDLPPYHQLDLSVRYARRLTGVVISAGADLLNVLDRRNVVDYALDFSYETQTGLVYDRAARATPPRTLVASISVAW